MPASLKYFWSEGRARLHVWYESSMANRVALRSQGVAAGVLMIATLLFYPLTASYVSDSVELRVRLSSMLLAQRLESELERALGEVEKLARLSLVANALADSTGNQGYLRPFLEEYGRSAPEMGAPALVDSAGNLLAGQLMPDELVAFRQGEALAHAPHIFFDPAVQANRLYLHFPVIYPATNTVEGILVAHLDLPALLKRLNEEGGFSDKLPLNVALRDQEGKLDLRQSTFSAWETRAVPVELSGPLAKRYGLQLRIEATTDGWLAYRALIGLSLALPLCLGALLWGLMRLSRRFSARDVEPLRQMGSRAMEIANAGPGGLRELEIHRTDEIGWMGTAFNEMVYSLKDAYARQEELVQARTRELAMAREHLRSVLDGIDDVIYALRADGLTLDYISASCAKVLGYPPERLMGEPGLFTELIHPADRALFAEARIRLWHGEVTEVRYRIRHADGSERWVTNRMNLIVDEHGERRRIGGLIRDITQAIEAENLLHLRERALASSSCGVVISDMSQPGQPIIYVNDSFERITGYASAEVLGQNCNMLQGPDGNSQPGIAEIRAAIAEGRSCKVILRNWRKDGEAFWNELALSPLTNDAGEVTHYIGIQNDISASIEATRALVDSEHRLALTVEALHEGIWDWQIESNVLVTSPSWARVLGLDPARYGAPHTLDTFLERLSPGWQARLREALAAHFASRNEDFYLEHECHLPDGRLIWAASHGRVVERGAQGEPLRMVGSIVDISDRIQSTDRIIRLMSQLDVILTLSPDGIIYFDEFGRISFVNRAFERMTGIKAGEATGLDRLEINALLRERADPDQRYPDCFLANRCDCDESEIGGCLLYTLKPRRSVLQLSVHEPSEGNSIVVYLRDVTRETEVDRMKSEFLSTAAHELRTPMTSILGYIELMRIREFDDAGRQRVFDTIHRQARRLTDLINELLDLARIEARGGKVFNMQPMAPAAVLREAINALSADRGRERLLESIALDLPEIDGDAAKLQQAFLNILSNAYKYSPDGGPVEVAAWTEAQRGQDGICVTVRDHGIGMSPADLGRVFERFFRADGSGNIPGTGLGMSLVKEIVETHRGEVTVDSELGEGTLVRLWLPLSQHHKAPDIEHKLTASHLGEMTLWLDHPERKAGMAGVLEKAGAHG